MPLTVECPSCSARITAPDKLAGKTARCPKCHEPFTLPAPDAGFEVVEDDEPVTATPRAKAPVADPGFEVVEDDEPVVATPRKKPRPPVVVDVDDDDEDRAPRKRKKAKTGLSPVVLYGSIAGVLLAIGVGVGVGIYFLAAGGKGGGGGLFGPTWTKFDAPDGSFSTSFPGGAPEGGDIMALITPGGTGVDPRQLAQAKKAMEQMGMSVNGWQRAEQGRKYVAGYLSVPQQLAGMMKPDQIINQGFSPQVQAGSSVLGQEDTTVAGQKAKQIHTKQKDGRRLLMRVFVVNARVYFLIVEGGDDLKADDATARSFFDKFELKK
jgi:hypothetical protein